MARDVNLKGVEQFKYGGNMRNRRLKFARLVGRENPAEPRRV